MLCLSTTGCPLVLSCVVAMWLLRRIAMARISKRTVDELHADGDKPAFLWDDQLNGFGAKALPSGAKRYVVKYRTNGGGRTAPQRWLTLGAHGQITPDQARSLAQQALAAVARGEDPQGAKFQQRTAPTLQDVWTRFASEHLARKKPDTRREYVSQWTDLISPKFGRVKVDALSRGDIDRFHKSMSQTPYRANRTLALFSRLMSLAETWEWRQQGTNPCKHIERFREKARTRFLTVEEITAIGQALRQLVGEGAISNTAANAIELLLLTGARLNEILSAQWTWIDEVRGIMRLPDSKTGAKSVYLSQAAVETLKRQKTQSGDSLYVFPSAGGQKHFVNLRKAWVRVCEHAGLEGVRLHDLRHTAASIAAGQGASLAIIGRLLGHTQAQTTLRYAHVDTDPAIKAANEIGKVVEGALRPAVKTKPITKEIKASRKIRSKDMIMIVSEEKGSRSKMK